jgi:hypothetical protein
VRWRTAAALAYCLPAPHLRSLWRCTGYLNDALGRLYKAGRDFKEETKAAIEERQRARQGAPEFELAPAAEEPAALATVPAPAAGHAPPGPDVVEKPAS